MTILPSLSSKISGADLFHYCDDQPCSWYEFAEAIFLEAEVWGLKTPNHIDSIGSVEYPTPAARPSYSVLDCSKIDNTFDVTPSDWRYGIKCVLKKVVDYR